MAFFVNIFLGIPLLIWGRKLFWLFVGAVGFLSGYWLAQNFTTIRVEWISLALGGILGLFGVLIAVMVQKFALTVTGFLSGFYLTFTLMDTFSINLGPWNWFAYVAGGMVGTLLILWFFDWALILLSTLVGAAMITQTTFGMIRFAIASRSVIFIVLIVIGIIIQYDQKQRES